MRQKLLRIYDAMLRGYGRQGWWPTTPRGENRPEYSNGPENERQQLEVIFGAILTQNTTWKNAERALVKLNERRLIGIDGILSAEHEDLVHCIKSSRYPNEKAERLKAVSRVLKENPIERLQGYGVSELRSFLLSIRGIGPETADSIILYAFNKPVFVVDAYTRRIISRIGLCGEGAKYGELQGLFMESLCTPDGAGDAELFNEYHALLVEHAKRYCNKDPRCDRCILKGECGWGSLENREPKLL